MLIFHVLVLGSVKIVEPPKKTWKSTVKALQTRFVNAMLGPPDSETTVTPEEIAENHETHEQRLKFLSQTPFMAKVLNVNAVIVMTACVFLYGFFH